MGYKFRGGIPLAVGYNLQSNRPLDEREIVLTKSDLTSIPNTFAGIDVKVEDEDFAVYRWNGIDQSNLQNWTKIQDISGGIGSGDMEKATYDTNNSGVVDDSEKLGGQLPGYYLDQTDIPPGGIGSGDMTKAIYDTNGNNVVDDSDKLGGQTPIYYDQNVHVADTAKHLTQDEKDALTGSPSAPTAANTIATQADIAAAGGGDMLKSVYDQTGNSIVDDSELLAGNGPGQYDQSAHVIDTTNPHSVTKSQVGLGSVDNTTDADKPISTATQNALDGKVTSVVAGANITVDNTDSQNPIISSTAGGQDLYDGVATTAEILALDPSLHVGEYWFSSTEKTKYGAYFVETTAAYAWQANLSQYDPSTDTYIKAETQDGQRLNQGQEQFFTGFNTGTVIGTELIPKIYKALGAYSSNDKFKEIIEVSNTDIGSTSLFGFNTTQCDLNDYTKILTHGDLNGVDTSLWPVNTVLYISSTAGDVTTVKPGANAYPVALVLKQHTTAGKLYVNTVNAHREDVATVAVELSRVNFTGDVSLLGLNSFYQGLRDEEGTVAEVIQTKAVSDNQKLPLDQDWISVPITIETTIGISSYTGQIEFSINDTGSQEKLYMEIYLADAVGDVLDSGSGLPNGTLGQPPMLILESGLLNSNTGSTLFAGMTGFVQTPVTVPIGNRVRYRILVEKVGTQGAGKTFSIYSGSDHDTFFNVPKYIDAKDVRYNNVDSTLAANNVKSALDELDSVKSGLAANNVFTGLNTFESVVTTFGSTAATSAFNLYDYTGKVGSTLTGVIGNNFEIQVQDVPAIEIELTTGKINIPKEAVGIVNTKTTNEPTGSDAVVNMVSVTQAEYDLGPINATTFYVING